MASEDNEQNGDGKNTSATVARAVAAAAASGAATYAIRRMVSHHDDGEDQDDGEAENESEDGDSEQGGLSAKKDDLTETLTEKASGAKKRAGKLVPGKKKSGGSGNGSLANEAWDSASQYLGPLLGEAASAAGKAVAERAPDVVRKEILPKFIAAFEKAS